MKNGDAKLQGLKFFKTKPASYRTRILLRFMSTNKGGFHVLKNLLIKSKYYWHLIQYRYLQQLQQECISEELKVKFRIKAIYHNSMVVELGSQL